ncbi:DUF3857 domain-containing transglutaminase family protein [Terrarubrum flagellatum]|uniref:DUF3857 domain-containing transglutaminase family protein n=1 Tax=Terrirubrum flagellatum TaxID=2895980 RepID=UPI0031455D63
MRNAFVAVAALIGLCFGLSASASAQPVSPPADAPFSRSDDIEIVIGDDGLVTMTARYRGKILSAAGVQPLGTYRDTVNVHFYDYALISAATIKPDGRRIPVDPSKTLVQAAAAAPEALHFFVDQKTYTTIFPEVAVGDEVEATTRLRQTRALLPDGVSWSQAFPRYVRRSGATVTVRAPKSAGLRVWQNGLDHAVEEQGDSIVHRFVYIERPYAPFQADSVDVFDYEPRFYFSTFKDWTAVAQGFWREGATKSDPTPEIEALAKKLVDGKNDDRARAEAIFNWVSGNVRYVNIVLGAGGWVPRDAGSVLANLYGDCKDHVTLMRALLRAAGVPADYALVNLAPRYEAYPFAVSQFDHIILYLPTLHLYVDPTASTSVFGPLETRLFGKPALVFNGEEAKFTRIPTVAPEAFSYRHTADVTIAADGAASGVSALTGNGSASSRVLAGARAAAASGAEAAATKTLQDQNWQGSARYDFADANARTDPATLKASFKLKANFMRAGPDGIRIPTGPRIFDRPFPRLLKAVREEREIPFSCLPLRYEENVIVHFPDGAKLQKTPEPIDVADARSRYMADYKFDGGVLSVRRLFEWKRDGVVCRASEIASSRRVLGAAMRDVNMARLFLGASGGAEGGKDADDDN